MYQKLYIRPDRIVQAASLVKYITPSLSTPLYAYPTTTLVKDDTRKWYAYPTTDYTTNDMYAYATESMVEEDVSRYFVHDANFWVAQPTYFVNPTYDAIPQPTPLRYATSKPPWSSKYI